MIFAQGIKFIIFTASLSTSFLEELFFPLHVQYWSYTLVALPRFLVRYQQLSPSLLLHRQCKCQNSGIMKTWELLNRTKDVGRRILSAPPPFPAVPAFLLLPHSTSMSFAGTFPLSRKCWMLLRWYHQTNYLCCGESSDFFCQLPSLHWLILISPSDYPDSQGRETISLQCRKITAKSLCGQWENVLSHWAAWV